MEVMAFDLGASNGRAIVGKVEKGKIAYHEVHRFANEPVKLGNQLYWDFPRLFHELKTALIKARHQGFKVASVGIDSWGVDYGLIDGDGDLMNNPVHYRDERSERGRQKLLTIIDEVTLKKETGMDSVSYNTVNQLMMDKLLKTHSNLGFLNIPDLFNFMITGQRGSEFSMATTTQLVDYETLDWNWNLIDTCGLDPKLFHPIYPSGRIVGQAKEDFLKEIGYEALDVVSVTSHDTASALQSISDEDNYLFVATGTWIIVGSSQDKMTMNQKVMNYGLSNEGGRYPKVNLLKNHVGMWILQESKREWEKQGYPMDYPELIKRAEESDIDSFIDIEDPRFFSPGDMLLKINDYLDETNQTLAESVGDYVRVIEASLAKQISQSLVAIEEALGTSYDKVYILGGGVRDKMLLNLIGQFSGKQIIKGEIEATTIGNIKDQLKALEK